ncbi:MAG: sensor domain-containing diguanylate cyclase [Alcaligenaceae bacterium]|nr:sensor domain-containing diguanylate cyclase [Alcaligenaceae bacterium]
MQPGSTTGTDTWGTNLADFFEIMPNSLWLEDYSALFELFAQWRAEGVTDLRKWLQDDITRVAACSACIKVLRVNQKTLDLLKAGSHDELATRLGEVLRDDMLEAHIEELEQLWLGNERFESKSVNYTLDGERLDVLIKAVVLPDHEKRWDRVLVSLDDITELEQAHAKVAQQERYATGIFEYAPVSLWVEDFSKIKSLLDEVRHQGITDFRTFTDVHPEFVERCVAEIRVIDVNRYTLEMFKAKSKEELLSNLPDVFREEMLPHFREQLIDLWEGRLFLQREVLNHGLDGTPLNIHLQFSVFAGYEKTWGKVLLALTDITARKKAEAYLEYLGKHDVLTKLKNRAFYVDELTRLERKGPFPVTVIMIDLNNLKEVNDIHGHGAGDDLLRRTGEVLQQATGKNCSAMRIGGDEFAILMPGATDDTRDLLLANLVKVTELNNQFYTGPALQMAVGWATCQKGERIEEAIREADRQMYDNKRQFYEQNA